MTQIDMDQVLSFATYLVTDGIISKTDFWEKLETRFSAKFTPAARMRITRGTNLVKVDKYGHPEPGSNNLKGTHYSLWSVAKKKEPQRAFTDTKKLQFAHNLLSLAGPTGVNREQFWKSLKDVAPSQKGSLLAQIRVIIRGDNYVLAKLASEANTPSTNTTYTVVKFSSPAVIVAKKPDGKDLTFGKFTELKLPTELINSIMADVDDQ